MAFDPTKPVRLRNGMEYQNYSKEGFFGRVWHGAYMHPVQGWTGISHYAHSGEMVRDGSRLDCFDLVNVPEKRTVEFWVNVYSDNSVTEFLSRSDADSAYGSKCRIACLHICREYEVGEGLE